MKHKKMTKEDLMREVKESRQQIEQLEAAEARRKQAERALADSEAIYHSLVESLPQNIFRKDKEGKFTFANSNFCATLGIPLHDVLGKTDFDFYPEELAKKYSQDDKKVMESGKVFDTVEEHQTPAGQKLYVQVVKTPAYDSKGDIIGIQGIFWDVSDQKRAEEALAEERNLLRTVINNLPDLIYAKDTESRFIIGNMAVARVMGAKTPDELLGKTDSDFYPEELATEYRADEQKVIQTGQPLANREEPLADQDTGKKGWLSSTKVPLRDSLGNTVGIVGIGRDITDRKLAEESLKEYSEKLEQMVEERTKELWDAQEKLVRKEKLAVLGQLAGGVGHELRNPLGAIKNAAYFLRMALEQPEPEVEETVDILEKEVATCERIISSLLGFARRKPPTRRKVNANDGVRDALSRIKAPKNIEVVSELQSLPPILADPDQLSQVFGNIILNAIQAMPEGGQLYLRSEVPSPGQVALSITDTGVGIPKENLRKLFEPLFTAKAKGIGLGLAVTKTLVEGHGGTIEVSSEIGKGSTFTVTLPIGKEEESQHE
jgi:two-component system cell cycle sensor histidine kinase/response regulator CckA